MNETLTFTIDIDEAGINHLDELMLDVNDESPEEWALNWRIDNLLAERAILNDADTKALKECNWDSNAQERLDAWYIYSSKCKELEQILIDMDVTRTIAHELSLFGADAEVKDYIAFKQWQKGKQNDNL